MLSIALSRAAFSYSGAAPLSNDLNFRIPTGWTGLVGANGSGKTTLLETLVGRMRIPEERLL